MLAMMRCSLLIRFACFIDDGAMLKGDGSATVLSATRRTSMILRPMPFHPNFAHKDSSGYSLGKIHQLNRPHSVPNPPLLAQHFLDIAYRRLVVASRTRQTLVPVYDSLRN